MTDQQLIKKLRWGWRFVEGQDISNRDLERAANRIAELKKQCSVYARSDQFLVEEIKELEAKLTKAVEALRVALEGLNWAKAYLSTSGIDSVPVNYADAKVYATLAELEKP